MGLSRLTNGFKIFNGLTNVEMNFLTTEWLSV